jgi:lipoyl(octanoyl) transferase
MRDCPNVGCSRSSAKDQFERARKPGLRGYSAAGGASSRKNEKVVSRIITNRNDLATRAVPVAEGVEWQISRDPVPYVAALAAMDKRVAAIANGTLPELVWLLEHPPLYTAGTSAKPQALIAPRLPVYAAGRGGQFTYHGPGQRVAYVMLDLNRRGPDVRRFVAGLEEWIIRTLARFGVTGERRAGRIGVWVRRPGKGPGYEDKIAAIGVRIKHWITLHGIALNVDCDLSHYGGIIPCGISEPRYGVTSLADLGRRATLRELDVALRDEFGGVFDKAAAPG